MVGCVEGILGIRPDLGGLKLNPSIPSAWDGFSMEKMFRGKKLSIRVQNPEHKESGISKLVLNGQELPDGYIPEKLLKPENDIFLSL